MKRRAETARKAQVSYNRALAALTALTVFALYSLYSFYQWKHYITPSWDLGIFAQLAQSYASFDLPPIVTIKGPGFNLWGDHFHPILLLLGPIYALFPSPATLLYVQNFLVALSVYLLVRFAQQVLGRWWSLALGFAYALSFGVQQAVSVQFHEVAFALPFLVLSLGNITLARLSTRPERELVRGVLWSLPLVLVKEDLGMTVLVIGLVVLWRSGWLRQARDLLFPLASEAAPGWGSRFSALLASLRSQRAALWGLGGALGGFFSSVLAVTLILPAFNTGGVFDYADRIDLPAALADPLQSLGLLFYPWEKSVTWGLLLLTGVLAWLFSPLAFIALPTLAWRFLSPQEGYWEPTWHYSLVLMPIVLMSLLDTIARIKVLAERPLVLGQKKRKVGPDLVLLFFGNAHRVLPALALLVALIMLPSQPLKSLADPGFATAKPSSSDLTKAEIVAAIPQDVSVAADLSVLTYLVPQREVYWIGHSGDPAPDYVIIDQAGTAWGGNPPQDPVTYASDRYGKPYQLEQLIGSTYILKKL